MDTRTNLAFVAKVHAVFAHPLQSAVKGKFIWLGITSNLQMGWVWRYVVHKLETLSAADHKTVRRFLCGEGAIIPGAPAASNPNDWESSAHPNVMPPTVEHKDGKEATSWPWNPKDKLRKLCYMWNLPRVLEFRHEDFPAAAKLIARVCKWKWEWSTHKNPDIVKVIQLSMNSTKRQIALVRCSFPKMATELSERARAFFDNGVFANPTPTQLEQTAQAPVHTDEVEGMFGHFKQRQAKNPSELAETSAIHVQVRMLVPTFPHNYAGCTQQFDERNEGVAASASGACGGNRVLDDQTGSI